MCVCVMGRAPCCDKKQGLKKGPWTPEEDKILVDYIQANGFGSWRLLPKLAGLRRCGKSCRLRWTNYLRPDIKRGPFTADEHKTIVQLHAIVGNKWSMIAAQLHGRTDNEIKNYWNTHLKKQLRRTGREKAPVTGSAARHMAQWETARLEAEARLSLLCTSSSTATTASSSSTAVAAAGTAEQAAPDVFLRLWNSEVGECFRRSVSSPVQPVAVKKKAVTQEVALPGEDSSAASNEMGTTTNAADEYEMFLDFAGEELGLFHGRHGGFSLFPPADVLAEASLDTAFK